MNKREELYSVINSEPVSREALEELYGSVWDREEVGKDFAILGFHPPFAVVRRIADGSLGTLLYQEMPRYYFYWSAEKKSHKKPTKDATNQVQ